MPCSYCGWSGVTGPRGAEKGIVKGLCKACYYYQKRFGTLVRPEKSRSKCQVDQCERDVVSHGYCDLHWHRVKRHGSPDVSGRPADWGKREEHPLYESWRWLVRSRESMCEAWHKDFWRFVKDVGARETEIHRLNRPDKSKSYGPDNFEWRESTFKLNGESERRYRARYMREWAQANPEKIRNNDLKKHYGITLEQYNAMLEAQGGVCAICRGVSDAVDHRTGKIRNLSVDHCHLKGHVRKLLCQYCNQGLGAFKDSPSLLRAAADYLEQREEAQDGVIHYGHIPRRIP